APLTPAKGTPDRWKTSFRPPELSIRSGRSDFPEPHFLPAHLGALFDWILEMMEDDTFHPIPITGRLDSIHQRWDGRTNSKNREWFVESQGGKYTIWTDWELAKE
ncbi:MAG: hypothetical protein M3P85_07440, partial [Actinomycetota bacterium]|nr:hypothetical protein [Actinomycetota bacterium]